MFHYTAYDQGYLLHEGHAPTVEGILSQFPGNYELDTELGDEQRFVDRDNPREPVLYICPINPAPPPPSRRT